VLGLGVAAGGLEAGAAAAGVDAAFKEAAGALHSFTNAVRASADVAVSLGQPGLRVVVGEPSAGHGGLAGKGRRDFYPAMARDYAWIQFDHALGAHVPRGPVNKERWTSAPVFTPEGSRKRQMVDPARVGLAPLVDEYQ
jgi:hypothetical protein